MKTHLEPKTAEFLSHNLNKVNFDTVTRAQVLRSIQAMIKAKSVKSTIWIDFVKNNIKGEDQSVLITLILSLTGMIISAYIPDDQIFRVSKEIFDLIYEFIVETENEEVRKILVNSLLGYLSESEDIKTALVWLQKGIITDSNGSDLIGTDLQLTQKYTIVKKSGEIQISLKRKKRKSSLMSLAKRMTMLLRISD